MLHLGELINKPTKAIDSGTVTDPLYVLEEVLDTEKYKDITTVTGLHLVGRKIYDYCLIRHIIREMMFVTDDPFWALSDDEKDIVGIYCGTTDDNLVGYYMSKGMSQVEAIAYHINLRSIDVRNASGVYYDRLQSPPFMATIMMYLGSTQGETFMDAVRNFATDVKDMARLGINYGNVNDGIMDYIESTGSYTDSGLKNYVMTPGLTLENLVKTLKDILYYGYTS